MDHKGMPSQELFQPIWSLVLEIGVQERHFNGLQSTCRGLASGWLLASFSGIGFALSNHLNVDIPPLLLIAAIAAAGSLGITLPG